jgi:hypothetical protein
MNKPMTYAEFSHAVNHELIRRNMPLLCKDVTHLYYLTYINGYFTFDGVIDNIKWDTEEYYKQPARHTGNQG